MSRVSPQAGHDGTGTRPLYWWRAVVTALIVAAGPGFFSYAMYDALYRDLSKPASEAAARAVLEQSEAVPEYSAGPPAAVWSFVRRASGGTSEKHEEPKAADAPVSDADKRFAAYLALRRIAVEDYGAERQSRLKRAMAEQSANGSLQPHRNYRAVCVRLCDGYFFPVGRVTGEDGLDGHAARCASSCGSEARLYVYPEDGGTPADMRDRYGNPYLALENAFRYQIDVDNTCTCKPQPWSIASRNRHREYARAETGSASGTRLPKARLAASGKSPSLAGSAPIRELEPLKVAAEVTADAAIPSLGLAAVPDVAQPVRVASLTTGTIGQPRIVESRIAVQETAYAAKIARAEILGSIHIDWPPKTESHVVSRSRARSRTAARLAQPVQAEPYVLKPFKVGQAKAKRSGSRFAYANRERTVAEIIHVNLYRRY